MSEVHSCRGCNHLSRQQESWEMPHIQWWECRAAPAMVNLSSFPFKNTTCKKWVPFKARDHSIVATLDGTLEDLKRE